MKRAIGWSLIAFAACIVVGSVPAGLAITLLAAAISAVK